MCVIRGIQTDLSHIYIDVFIWIVRVLIFIKSLSFLVDKEFNFHYSLGEWESAGRGVESVCQGGRSGLDILQKFQILVPQNCWGIGSNRIIVLSFNPFKYHVVSLHFLP